MSHTLGLNSTHFTILPVAGSFAFPFAAYNFLLQARVIRQRLNNNVTLGDRLPSTTSTNESLAADPLYTATRSHVNFLETVPLALICAGLAELNGANRRILTGVLSGLFLARVAHVELGILGPQAQGMGRRVGYYFSMFTVPGLAGWALYLCKKYWGY